MKNHRRRAPIEEYLPLRGWQKFIVVLSVAYSVGYFVWRALVTINPEYPVYAWLFYSVEVIGFISSLIFIDITWKLRKRRSPPLRSKPTVDVYITTYNEGPEILEGAIYHCLNMDYPHETYVLDDGRRPEIEKLAKEMGARYITRSKNTHAKAGNLNNALKQTEGDIIAVFDADGVPHKEFLTRLLGYFDDPNVGLVQVPQSFYNLDSFQHLNSSDTGRMWHEQSLFFDIIQCGRDYHEASMWCGSGSLVRRAALEEIGGVATDTVTEDHHTTLHFHLANLKTVYHSEALAFCLAPASVFPYVVQRGRWALGTVQMMRGEWRDLFVPGGGLSFHQKIAYLMGVHYFTSFQKIFYYLAPFIYTVFGISPVIAPQTNSIFFFLNLVLSVSTYLILARGRGRILASEIFFLYTIWAYMRAVFEGILGIKVPFKVTSKSPAAAMSFAAILPTLAVTGIAVAGASAGAIRFDPENIDLGIVLATCFSTYFIIVGTLALILTIRRPMLGDAYSFYDYRPLLIKKINGVSVIGENAAIACVISEKTLRFIHVHEFKKGARLTLDLDLPDAYLRLEAEVVDCRKIRSSAVLYEVGLRYRQLSSRHKLELIRYFFEDATPRAFKGRAAVASNGAGRRKNHEQRVEPRLDSLLPVFVSERDKKGDPEVALLVEFSSVNARIKMPAEVKVGSVIRLHIPWMNSSVLAKVARCTRESGQVNPPYDIGLSFTDSLMLPDEAKALGRASSTRA